MFFCEQAAGTATAEEAKRFVFVRLGRRRLKKDLTSSRCDRHGEESPLPGAAHACGTSTAGSGCAASARPCSKLLRRVLRLRRATPWASLAPAVFDSMRSKRLVATGFWSALARLLDGNDGTAETPGLCVPGRLAAWSSINSTEQESEIDTFHADNDNCHQKLVQHRKTHGSWMRLQKMTRCVSLVTQHERSRHLQYAFLFLTRPDLYLCSVSRFDLALRAA